MGQEARRGRQRDESVRARQDYWDMFLSRWEILLSAGSQESQSFIQLLGVITMCQWSGQQDITEAGHYRASVHCTVNRKEFQ